MRFERFSDVLNYLIDRWPLKSLDEARNWPYINSLFWGVQEWLIDPEEGGKPQPIAPCTSLVDHCVDAIQKVKDKKQLSLVGSLTLPQHLAQKVHGLLNFVDFLPTYLYSYGTLLLKHTTQDNISMRRTKTMAHSIYTHLWLRCSHRLCPVLS